MNGIVLIGGGIIVGVALIYDPASTIRFASTAISSVGVTWVVKKITENINKDASQIIHFTGWCVAGVSMIGLVKNAMNGVLKLNDAANTIQNAINFIVQIADKITFWE